MATITTVVDSLRGCGWRKPGGIYLMSDGIGVECLALPIPLHVCPTCGHGVKPARGLTWVEPDALLAGRHHTQVDLPHAGCPLNEPGLMGDRAGLLWVGESFYASPNEWLSEGRRMGFSRRLNAVPRGFVVGETWVLTAHRKAVPVGWLAPDGNGHESFLEAEAELVASGGGELSPVFEPGIFHVWRPDRIEYVVTGDETEEELDKLERRGLTLVKVERAEQRVFDPVPA